MIRILPICWLAALAVPGSAYAQSAAVPESYDQSVTVTATRVATPVDDVAAGVSVVTESEMQQMGDVTLADALSSLPGVHLVQAGGPGAAASLFIRGADSDQVQVLIDGVPANDPSGPGGAFNFGVDTLTDIARIEVVRGPMSAVYGSGAIGGVVNIVTDRGNGPLSVDASVAGGYPASALLQARVGGVSGAFDYTVAVATQSMRGYDATPARETVYTGLPNGFDTEMATAGLGYTPVDGTRLSVDLRGRSSLSSYDEQGAPAYDGNNNVGHDNDFFIRAGLDSRLWNGALDTNLATSFEQEYRAYATTLRAQDPNQQQDDSRYTGQRLDIQWTNSLSLPDTGLTRATTLTAGYEHSSDSAAERLNSAYFGYPYTAQVNATDQRDSGFAGLQSTLLSRAVLSANIRQESVSGVGQAFTWRAGVSYAIAEIATHVKASFGTAFLAPSLYDRYGVDDAGYVGNPGLKPERSRSGEVGLVTQLEPWARIETTYFHTDVRNLIETVFAPVYTSENVAAARMQGVETALDVTPTGWLTAKLSYTYTDARNTTSGQQLLRRPYDQAALTLITKPGANWSVVPQIQWIGSDLDYLVNNQGFATSIGRNPGAVLLDVNASYQINPRWQVFIWGKNLTNAAYEPASGYVTPGASFLAGIRFHA
ncbi:MAG: TonB-dependent receptor [Acidocella sp.]|nr:TonB-dependent receptor [Acidocella sp.]